MFINSYIRDVIIILILQTGKLRLKEIDFLQFTTQLLNIGAVICTQAPKTPSTRSFHCLLVFHWINNSMKRNPIPT